MSKRTNLLTGFLGISLFMFGTLKFIDPFKTWYTVQIESSDLPYQTLAYWLGQLGEIFTGLGFLLLLFLNPRVSVKLYRRGIAALSVITIIMMCAAIYVHLHPDVPNDVLPLKIREPFIPGFFILMAVTLTIRTRKNTSKQAS